MTIAEAIAYNQAITDAVAAYLKGIGAIKALKIKQVVTVEHIGTTTKQEVVEIDTNETE